MGNQKKYKVGYTCGVFDLLHLGHLNLFERCKEMCEYLVVGICNDDYVINVKHKKPFYSEEERIRMVSALKVVDKVILVNTEETNDKMKILKKIDFDVLFSGSDWKGSERYIQTEKQFAALGKVIEYFPYTENISTTQIKEYFK